MRFMSSLRMQSLTLLIGSLLLMLVISIASVLLLAAELRNYRQLMEGPEAAAGLIAEANLSFKEQVQEWKNVLLRGADQASLDRYWGQFQQSEAQVQSLLEQVARLDIDQNIQQQARTLHDQHRQLAGQYRSGLERFIASDRDPVAGDAMLRGIDRDAAEQMSRLTEELNSYAASEVQRIREATLRTVILGVIILLGSALCISVIASLLLTRRLVNPISELVAHMEQLALGRFDQPINSDRVDELGILARSADQLRGFLQGTAAGLRHSTSELDQASGGLNSIATRMAHGSREQFSRTDQVATAMQEMSAELNTLAAQLQA